ncbi:MAG: T9SS type A sorting domain-containing protein [Bacteroidetes bacterium]|nr:T9SS type A sorting domain-containing protein [Bacteroidota bacterium]
MKTVKSILIITLLLISNFAYSQSGWYRVSDSVRYLWLEGIQMTSANTGYACGAYYYSLADRMNKHKTDYTLGAFLKTTNGGLNWQRIDDPRRNIDDVYFLNDLTGYFIAWNGPATGYYPAHIFKTTDGCATWARHDSISNGSFFKIKFFDANTGMIAGKYGEAEFTTNGGVNWIYRGIWAYWMEPQGMWCIDANTWLVGDGDVYARTTDQGLTWNKDTLRTNTFYFFNQTTGITGTIWGKFYKTTNSGLNWLEISSSFVTDPISLIFTNSNTGYTASYNAQNVYKTTNGGINWTEQFVTSNQEMYAVSFINNFTGFAAGTNGEIFRTTNGGSVFVSNISNEVPEKFELGQNYPNPFNQSTIFNVQCSMKSDVCVKVYDAAGREVQTLVNETLAPGTYQIRFDGSGLSSGLFYYSMSVDGKQTAVRKMVMVK